MPSIDISSGTVSGGEIIVGEQFQFSTNVSGHITIIAPASHVWFSPNDASFEGPGSVVVTAELVSTGAGWGYTVRGMHVSNNNPHIPVGAAMPQHHAKAS